MALVRSAGLELGVYTAAGDRTCSGRPGSCGHEAGDSEQYVRWGISHVKEDALLACPEPSVEGAAGHVTRSARFCRIAASCM